MWVGKQTALLSNNLSHSITQQFQNNSTNITTNTVIFIFFHFVLMPIDCLLNNSFYLQNIYMVPKSKLGFKLKFNLCKKVVDQDLEIFILGSMRRK